jgi:hypothetical protein
MGCDLGDYRARVGNWAGRFSWRGVSRRGDANRTTGDYGIDCAKFHGVSCVTNNLWS